MPLDLTDEGVLPDLEKRGMDEGTADLVLDAEGASSSQGNAKHHRH